MQLFCCLLTSDPNRRDTSCYKSTQEPTKQFVMEAGQLSVLNAEALRWPQGLAERTLGTAVSRHGQRRGRRLPDPLGQEDVDGGPPPGMTK